MNLASISKFLCLFLAGVFSFLPSILAAQSDLPERGCTVVATKTDNNCTSNQNCTTTNGCSSVQFTPACTGLYDLTASVICPGGTGCEQFQCCVHVYDGQGQALGNCHNSPCNETCTSTCTNEVCLVNGRTYTLYVCFQDCGDGTCQGTTTCYAYGEVVFNTPQMVCQ